MSTTDDREPFVLRVTFGVQYSRIDHPTLAFAHPEGWLEVRVLGAPDAHDALDTALDHVRRMTGGQYAFDYSAESWAEQEPRDVATWYPLGVLATLTIDYADMSTRLDVHQEFRTSRVPVSEE